MTDLEAWNNYACSSPADGGASVFRFDTVPELTNAPSTAANNACVLKPASYGDSITGVNLSDCDTGRLKAKLAPLSTSAGSRQQKEAIDNVLLAAKVQTVQGQQACVIELAPDLDRQQYVEFQTAMHDAAIKSSDAYTGLERLVNVANSDLVATQKVSADLASQITSTNAANATLQSDTMGLQAQYAAYADQIKRYNADTDVAKTTLAKLKRRTVDATSRIQTANNTIGVLNGKISDLNERRTRVEAENAGKLGRINGLRSDIATRLERISSTNAMIAKAQVDRDAAQKDAKERQAQRAREAAMREEEARLAKLRNNNFGNMTPAAATTLCMQVPNGSTKDGEPIKLATCGTSAQNSDQVALDPNTGLLIFKHSLKCATAPNGTGGFDAAITQQTCDAAGRPSQSWRVNSTGQLRAGSAPGGSSR